MSLSVSIKVRSTNEKYLHCMIMSKYEKLNFKSERISKNFKEKKFGSSVYV